VNTAENLKEVETKSIEELRHYNPLFDRVIMGVICYHISRLRLDLTYDEIEMICNNVKSTIAGALHKSKTLPPPIH